jgi:hypothetical protein
MRTKMVITLPTSFLDSVDDVAKLALAGIEAKLLTLIHWLTPQT